MIEYQMRCNTCGRVFCYTDADVKSNKREKRRFLAGAFLAITNPISGSLDDAVWADYNMAEAERNIKDLNRCPYCGSRSLSLENQDNLGNRKYRPPIYYDKPNATHGSSVDKQPRNPGVYQKIDELNESKNLLEYRLSKLTKPAVFYVISAIFAFFTVIWGWGMINTNDSSFIVLFFFNLAMLGLFIYLGKKNKYKRNRLEASIEDKERRIDELLRKYKE